MGEEEKKPSGSERREFARYEAELSVDYASEETFLFAPIQNISEMGIFIASEVPCPIGTELRLRFSVPGGERLHLQGRVTWVNLSGGSADSPNPGMGVRFEYLSREQSDRIVELVRTIAYLGDDDPARG